MARTPKRFTDQTDTPDTLSGEGDRYVKVNAGGTALEFDTPSGTGDVTGPAGGTVDGDVAVFDDTTGKVLRKATATEADITANNAKISYTDAAAVALNTTHRSSDGKDHSDVVLNNTHRALTAEHIDWSVTGVEDIHADRYVGGSGGATDTVTGSSGITNVGDNTDADLAPTYGTLVNTICQGNDARLSDDRTPTAHTHVESDITNLGAYLDETAHDALAADNPHSVTKAQVGLGNVDNTTDLAKPISTATQTALDGKSATTHDHDGDYAPLSHVGGDSHIDWTVTGAEDIHADRFANAPAEVNDLSAAVTWANVPNGNITEGSVTQHSSAVVTKANVEAVLTGEISTHTHAGGGSGATPAVELYFEGTLSAAGDTNAVSTDYTWNDAEEHANVTHTDGDSVVAMSEAGEYWLYTNIEVTDATANNRSTWKLALRHLNSSDALVFEYSVGAANYIRDDAATYDSGGIGGFIPLVIGAGEKIQLRSYRLDTGDAPDDNPADTAVSYLRIMRKTYT